MKLRQRIAIVSLAAGLAIAVLALLRSGSNFHGRSKSSRPDEFTAPPRQSPSPAFGGFTYGKDSPEKSPVHRRFAAFIAELRSGVPRPRAVQLLEELKKFIHALPPDRAAEALVAFLETGDDEPTGLGFEIGEDGVMTETPTVRAAAIDLLGQTDPPQSVDYSRKLLRLTESADEYALALRNLGWGCPELVAKDELSQGFRSMLAHSEWRSQPSRGFLEAFDIAVAAGSVADVAPLLESRPFGVAEPALSRAAFVALDRMMLAQPETIVASFRKNPALLADTPFHRASLMARLDPRVGSQRDLLESYLMRNDHDPEEIQYFSEIFPNPNRFFSNRLVTTPEKGGGMEDQAALDDAVLQTLGLWLDDPRFAGCGKAIAEVRSRLIAQHPSN